MNKFVAALAVLLSMAAVPAFAQVGLTQPGQQLNGINQQNFNENGSVSSMGDFSMNPAVVAAGTTQTTATVLGARTNIITSCPTGAGVMLPAVPRFIPVMILNRSGAACLVYPTNNATAESAPGTAGAVNAGVSVANNTDVTFRPQSAGAWLQ